MRRGFTLIELMITLAVMGVLVTLAAPSFYEYILTQRLKAASQQLVTDLQFARSEAASRNELVHMRFSSTPGTCYTIFTGPSEDACNCINAVGPFSGPVCPAAGLGREIRSVYYPVSTKIEVLALAPGQKMSFNPSNGAMSTLAVDLTGAPAQAYSVDVAVTGSTRKLRTVTLRSGRPNVCVPAGSTAQGTPC